MANALLLFPASAAPSKIVLPILPEAGSMYMSLEPNESKQLIFPFKVSEQSRRLYSSDIL